MRITLLVVGKTDEEYLKNGIDKYIARIGHYLKFTVNEIVTPKNFRQLQPAQLKEAEGKLLLRFFEEADQVILLDENGRMHTSVEFSAVLQKYMNAGTRHLMFVVGGAYGFSEEVVQAATGKLSLSAMTFSHQMVRLFFTEQLYRAFSIIKNEPYHNN